MKLKFIFLNILILGKNSFNSSNTVINFTEIPNELQNDIKKYFYNISNKEQITLGYFILIIMHALENHNNFILIKEEYEKNKSNNILKNYYLLIMLFAVTLITDSEEVLHQKYKIYLLEKKTSFLLKIIVLYDITETQLNMFKKLLLETQQNKDFIFSKSFEESIKNAEKSIKNKKIYTIAPDDIILYGNYIGFIPFPKEFLQIKNLLKKYGTWMCSVENTAQGYNLMLITQIIQNNNHISYETFKKELIKILLLDLIKNIINGKSNYIYTINGENPIQTLDNMLYSLIA